MLQELGVPSDLEGLVGVQLFKASRGHAGSEMFEVSSRQLDGARLRLGLAPDEYLQLRGLLAAQLEDILSGFKDFDARLERANERERRNYEFAKRPMALLIGWRETAVRRRRPLDDWDWVDLVHEHRRGVELREAIHRELDCLAAALAVGLGEFLEDRVATDSFWTAPKCLPVVVIRESVGSAEAFQVSEASFPRTQAEEWIDRISQLPEALSAAIAEPLNLLAASKAIEPGWLRFTFGWAALERLATELGSRFDDKIVVEQRRCPSCGADVTDRRPTIRPRLHALMGALEMPDEHNLKSELARINGLRGRSHVGEIPEGTDLLAPERLASGIVRAAIEDPGRIPG
jgi:hypothetical protein